MKPKISQNVTVRRNRQEGERGNRVERRFSKFNAINWQKGSINSNTLTLVFSTLVIVGVGVLGFFYLSQVVGTASQGTDIQELEERIMELKEDQKEVELEGARLRSMDNIEERVDKLNLVDTSKVTFLEMGQDKVAALDK